MICNFRIVPALQMDCKWCWWRSCRWCFEGNLARNLFLRDSSCMKPCTFSRQSTSQTSMIYFCGATGARRSPGWCFSRQRPSPNLADLSLRCNGCKRVSCVVGSRSDHSRIGSALSMGCHLCFVFFAVDRIPL